MSLIDKNRRKILVIVQAHFCLYNCYNTKEYVRHLRSKF